MKRMLSRIPNVFLLLVLLLGMALSWGCGKPASLTIGFTTTPQIIEAGKATTPITIEIQDSKGNPVSTGSDTVVNLESTSSTGSFSLSESFKWVITSITIPGGSSSASFYYKDTKAGSPTITATEKPSQGWTAATQTETVSASTLDHFSIASIGNQIQNAVFNIKITAIDAFENNVTSYNGQNALNDSTGTINPSTTGPFVNGVWTGDITIASAQNGITITTSSGDKNGKSNAFDIAFGNMAKLAFTNPPQTFNAGEVSGLIVLQMQDASGNLLNATADTNIILTSSSSNGMFYSDAEGLNVITVVRINSGTSTASFYYKDTTEGSPNIAATESLSQGLAPATQAQTVNSAALDHFSLATIGSQTKNTRFGITITALDVYGNTVKSYTGQNTLSDTTGTINPTNTGTFSDGVWAGDITISAVKTGVTINTSGGTKNGISNAFDILAGLAPKLAFTSLPQTLTVGNVSEVITIEMQDESNNPFNLALNTTINLTSSSSGATFYSDAEALNPISSVMIDAGSSSASFYLKDTVSGSPTIATTEASQGGTSATQVETINAGPLDHFYLGKIDNQTENNSFSVKITAQDVFGNIVTSYTGQNTLSDSTGTISPKTTGAFTDGIWEGNITISSVINGILITTSGADKSGASNTFDILAAGLTIKLAFVTAPRTVEADNVSEIITIQTQDSSGIPYNVTSNTTLNLASSSTVGTFYSDAQGSIPITSVMINSGTNSASFYYRDTFSGSSTITATESPLQGWTKVSQTITINPITPPSEVVPKAGIPIFVVIVVGVVGIILGLVGGYFIILRFKPGATQGEKEIAIEPQAVSVKPKKKVEKKAPAKTEPSDKIVQKQAEKITPPKQEPAPAASVKPPEKIEAVKPQPIPAALLKQSETVEIVKPQPATATSIKPPDKVEVPKTQLELTMAKKSLENVEVPEQAPPSDLESEIETNHQIAAASTLGNLIAYETKIWESKHGEVNPLPLSVKDDVTRAYSAMSLANSIVWLAKEIGRHSPNMDDQYAKLSKTIEEQLNKVKQLIEESQPVDSKKV